MWVPVLAANVLAVALAIGLPLLDEHLGDRESLPIAAVGGPGRSSARSPAA